jgi:hypothetical protein
MSYYYSKYTGPQTNDIIQEIPTEDHEDHGGDNDSEEGDDISV